MSLSEIFMLPGVSGGPRLVISDASESFDFEANSHSFFVNSNLTWSWSADVAWITSDEDTPQTGSQTFSYSVTENISTERTGTITFTAGDITRTHTVTQGPYPILTIDDEAHTFDSDADSLTFNVTSNTDWTWFASEDWVTSSEAVFQNGNQAFTYSVTANTGAERTATITFVDVQAGVVTAVHSITQSAEATPLLLDTYTGAVGFSLRKIRTAYIGDCIRVRRASDDAEQDIGFSGNDLDTAAIETFCSGTTGHVTTWYDQVGSNDAVQATTTRQPIIYESGAVVVNEHGLPAIRFFDDDAGAIETNLRAPAWAVADASWLAHSMAYSLKSNGVLAPVGYGSPLRSQHFSGRPRLQVVRTGGSKIATSASALSLDTTTIRLDSADRTNIEIWLDTSATVDVDNTDRNEDAVVGDYDIGGLLANSEVCDTLISEIVGFTADESANNLAIRTDQYNYWTDVTPPAPLTLSIDSASATFNQNAQSGSFEVTSNTDWTWTSSAAWLTSAETSPQNGNQTFSYSVSENTGTERVATITLSITGTSVIHTVTQDAAPVPPVDPDIEDFTEFDYVADMVSSMDAAKGAGQVWYAQGYRYVELDGSATDQHLTTAGGVKLRALQDGSGAVTTEQLGWLPAVVQETAAESQIPKLDTDSVLTFTDFYDCDDFRVVVPNNVNVTGAFRRYSGFEVTTDNGNKRLRFNDGGSLRRIKMLCGQTTAGSGACEVFTDRFIVDDVQAENKAATQITLYKTNNVIVENSEFWDSHWQVYLTAGKRQRVIDCYFTADWDTALRGEGIKSVQNIDGGTDSLKSYGCYFDRLLRDGIDITGGGKAIRIVQNNFNLNGVGRNAENVGTSNAGIDIKLTIASGTEETFNTIDHLDVSDNVFWGAGPWTTQTHLDDEPSEETTWQIGLKGIVYVRNSYEHRVYFGVRRGRGPEIELFSYSCNDRLYKIGIEPEIGSTRNMVCVAGSATDGSAIVNTNGLLWLDFANYITLETAANALNVIEYNAGIGPVKITGHVTKLRDQYAWWTRTHQENDYAQLRVSVSSYGPGDMLQAWSLASAISGGSGFMIAGCFGDAADLLQHRGDSGGKINDVYILGNIVKATNFVNDLGTDIRTGLWIRQNTSDGANARTGAGTTSPVIEQNVGVS